MNSKGHTFQTGGCICIFIKEKLIELLIHKMFYGICLSYNGK